MAIGGWRESEKPSTPFLPGTSEPAQYGYGEFLRIEKRDASRRNGGPEIYSVSCDSSAVTVQSLFATILRWRCGWTFITEVEVDHWSQ